MQRAHRTTLRRKSYPIRGMAAAENEPLVLIVHPDDPRHDSGSAAGASLPGWLRPPASVENESGGLASVPLHYCP
jgi:hypothetical protein